MRRPPPVLPAGLADVPHSLVKSYHDILQDRHIKETGAVAWICRPNAGRVPIACIPASPPDWVLNLASAPNVGQHSYDVLNELGIGSRRIRSSP